MSANGISPLGSLFIFIIKGFYFRSLNKILKELNWIVAFGQSSMFLLGKNLFKICEIIEIIVIIIRVYSKHEFSGKQSKKIELMQRDMIEAIEVEET